MKEWIVVNNAIRFIVNYPIFIGNCNLGSTSCFNTRTGLNKNHLYRFNQRFEYTYIHLTIAVGNLYTSMGENFWEEGCEIQQWLGTVGIFRQELCKNCQKGEFLPIFLNYHRKPNFSCNLTLALTFPYFSSDFCQRFGKCNPHTYVWLAMDNKYRYITDKINKKR